MARCAYKDHEWRRVGEQAHRLHALPFACIVPGCGAMTHSAACVDEDGKVECICGLSDQEERLAEHAAAALEAEADRAR